MNLGQRAAQMADWIRPSRFVGGRRRKLHRSEAEMLEVRSLLTSLVWSDTNSLTVSFAPDGTDIAGNTNGLNGELDQLAESAVWQQTVVSAFQAWIQDLGFGVTVVSDNGAEFGASGATHGDSRFGDVRVGAVPLSPGVLATAIPQSEFVSGTWAGDMLLNSTVELTSLDQLYSLALHEAGHILGLEHSPDPTSAMYDHAGLTILAPTADDLAAIRSLYGRGAADRASTEQDDAANGQLENAERIGVIAANGLYPRFESSGTIVDAQDVDTYVFRPRDLDSDNDGVATIVLRAKTSGLVPKVSLVKSNGRKVETTIVANGNGVMILQASDLEADEDYIVRVQSATADAAFSSGEYDLAVSFSESKTVLEPLARGTLDRETLQQNFVMYSAKSQLFNFQLAVNGSSRQSAAAVVVLSVYDESQRLVFRVAVRPGDTGTANTVLLSPGQFEIVVEEIAVSRRPLPELEFQVRGSVISDDAGPLPNNPTSNPAYGTGGNLPYVYPHNVTSNRPFNVQRPVTTNPPVFTPLTWQQMLLMYPWLAGGANG